MVIEAQTRKLKKGVKPRRKRESAEEKEKEALVLRPTIVTQVSDAFS